MEQPEPEQPALSIRLLSDMGKLPAGVSILFPRDVALALLSVKNVAVPVGSFDLFPDLTLDESDLEHIGFDPFKLESTAA